MTAQASGENVAGDWKPAVAALPLSVSYDAANDILTVDGFKFAGELLRTFTVTPCGTMFRIVERKDGVITVSLERDPIAAAASDMLAALKAAVKRADDNLVNFSCRDDDCAKDYQMCVDAIAKAECP